MLDLARDIDMAIAELNDCNRLIVDLRGNPGGGTGGLRLMSYLTADKIPVGYSLTRPRGGVWILPGATHKIPAHPFSQVDTTPARSQIPLH